MLCYMQLSGHSMIDSAYSCADSCGSCDGARCDRCHEIYVIEHDDGTEEYYSSEEDARANGWYDWND